MTDEASDEDRRRQANRLFDAADQPVIPAGAVSLLQSRIFHHHLPHRSEALAAWCRSRSKSPSQSSNTNSSACPDSTGFGDYTETGQVIPGPLGGRGGRLRSFDVSGRRGADRRRPRALGFPKKLASPKIAVESDVLVGTLHYGSVAVRLRTMGYKHRPVDPDAVLKGMKAPNFMLKIIPHVDGTRGSANWVRYYLEDITLKEAWTGPAALGLFPHALADVARLPVREVVSALHCKADLTLGLGRWRSTTLAMQRGDYLTHRQPRDVGECVRKQASAAGPSMLLQRDVFQINNEPVRRSAGCRRHAG